MGRQNELTAAGESLYRMAKPIFEQCESMRRTMLRLGKINGSLRCSTGSHFFNTFYKEMMEFGQKRPNIHISVISREPPALMPALLSGEDDLIVDSSFNLPLDESQIEKVRIGTVELKLIVSPNHPLAREKSVKLAELTDETFLYFDKFGRDLLAKLGLRGRPSISLDENFNTHSGTLITRILVSNNEGVGLAVPSDIANADVCFIDIEEPDLRFETYLIWKKNNPNPCLHMYLDKIFASEREFRD